MPDKYIFIGGVGRSGTSIVRELFSSNKMVATFPFEYRFIIDPDGIIDYLTTSTNSWSPYIADRRLKRLESFLLRLGKKNNFAYFFGWLIRSSDLLSKRISADAYHGWELADHFPNYYKHVDILISELEIFQFPAIWAGADSFKLKSKIKYSPPRSSEELHAIFSRFLTNLFHDMLEKYGKFVLVEDNTWNLLFINPISKIFIDSKFIHVYRDPRDVVCSFVKQRWMPSNLVQSATICRDLYLQILNNLSVVEESRVFSISLEELVFEQQVKVPLMADFAGLEACDSMIEFPLSSRSIGRWKRDLNEFQLLEVEPIIKDITVRLGYVW